MPKKPTLTARQWEIVNLMRDGWKIGVRYGDWAYLLQKDGVGYDSKETIKVSSAQVQVLHNKDIIFRRKNMAIWQLTELGKTLEKEKA